MPMERFDIKGLQNYVQHSQKLRLYIYVPIWKFTTLPRCYPPALGRTLLRLHDEAKHAPQFDLRQKVALDPQLTDLQIFQGLSHEDCWVDASLPQVFLYLYQHPNLKIPDEWEYTMRTFHMEMQEYVAWLQLFALSMFNKIAFISPAMLRW